MRYIDRSSPPKLLDSSDYLGLRDEYEAFRAGGGTRAYQTKLDPGASLGLLSRMAIEYVADLFRGKCAYTEVRDDDTLFHLHRPEADAYDEQTGTFADHYWWTAMWWRNWYLATADIASLKRNNFPVIDDRAEAPTLDLVQAQRTLEVDFPRGTPHHDLGMILDPCEDRPEWHLLFRYDGTVEPWRGQGPVWAPPDREGPRGPETIRLLDLNVKHLVEWRSRAIQNIVPETGLPPKIPSDADLEDREYTGVIRQVIAARIVENIDQAPMEMVERFIPEVAPHVAVDPQAFDVPIHDLVSDHLRTLPDDLAGEIRRALGAPRIVMPPEVDVPEEEQEEEEEKKGALPPDGREHADRAPLVVPRTAAITHVEIRNFKIIDEVVIDFPIAEAEIDFAGSGLPEDKERVRGWKALLGENGSGKSSVLQAIGLALAGNQLGDLMEHTGLEWRRLHRRNAEQEGQVLLEFTGGTRVDLRFDAENFRFEGPVPHMEGYVRGFGATRLLGPDFGQATDNVRLDNLYNPRLPVVDAEAWLGSLEDEGDFNVVGVAIAGLLDRGSEVVAAGNGGKVDINTADAETLAGVAGVGPAIADRIVAYRNANGPFRPISRVLEVSGVGAGRLAAIEAGAEVRPRFVEREGDSITIGGDPLEDISDGYRSVIAMACDLMAGAGTGLSDMSNATGIVLIDEIGAHLHPKWKMDITKKLRQVFPSMQFVISTHEPLCLLGLVENEVIRVRAKEEEPDANGRLVRRASFEEIDQSPTNFRVDRLLTSEFFGLHSTVDPTVDRLFQEYYALIALPAEQKVEHEGRIRELRGRLSRHGVLGYTRRDQLVYDAIDQFLAEEDSLDPTERKAERDATLVKVREIWENVANARAARRQS